MIRWFYNRGKRFYVIDITGWPINPGTTGSNSHPATTAYTVLDANRCHEQVASFVPRSEFGHDSRTCKERAEALADKLNREEDAA